MTKVALTIDDLPQWPHEPYPAGYTADSVTDAIITALDKHGVGGVFAFSNSRSLVEDPALGRIFDRWLDAGHYVANHTHSHHTLHDVSAETYINDIELATQHLAPWMARSPGKFFRYTLNRWGETEEKVRKVKAHLDANDYVIGEVTTWFFEWNWNRAYENCLRTGDQESIAFLKRSFLDFTVAQMAFDTASVTEWYGQEIEGIALIHNMPFLAEVLDEMLARLIAAGVEFVPFEAVAVDPFYDRAASVVTDKFLVYWRKLAAQEGRPYPVIAPGLEDTYSRVLAMFQKAPA